MPTTSIRLLDVRDYSFKQFQCPDNVAYLAISHKWGADEATLADLTQYAHQPDSTEPRSPRPVKAGVQKILDLCAFIREVAPEVHYLWIDTCCINQNNPTEVNSSIPRMYKWYSKALACLAYLHDVTVPPGHDSSLQQFQDSVWHQRGWTLQELLSPRIVIFLNHDRLIIGHKGSLQSSDPVQLRFNCDLGPSMNDELSRRTGIDVSFLERPELVLEAGPPLVEKWVSSRQTEQVEDIIYCRLGLLGVFMEASYGEGVKRAQRRLQEELDWLANPSRRLWYESNFTTQPPQSPEDYPSDMHHQHVQDGVHRIQQLEPESQTPRPRRFLDPCYDRLSKQWKMHRRRSILVLGSLVLLLCVCITLATIFGFHSSASSPVNPSTNDAAAAGNSTNSTSPTNQTYFQNGAALAYLNLDYADSPQARMPLFSYHRAGNGTIVERLYTDGVLGTPASQNPIDVATDIAPTSPLVAVLWLRYGVTFRQLFYISPSGLIMTTATSDMNPGWTTPYSIITAGNAAMSGSPALAVCASNSTYNGLRVYYTSQKGFREIATVYADTPASQNWHTGPPWAGADASAGVACTTNGTMGSYLNLYLKNSTTNSLQQWVYIEHTGWTLGIVGPGNMLNGSSIAATNDFIDTDYIYYQDTNLDIVAMTMSGGVYQDIAKYPNEVDGARITASYSPWSASVVFGSQAGLTYEYMQKDGAFLLNGTLSR